MNQLRIIRKEEIERAELRSRLELANRPSLAVKASHLNDVASRLASNNADRSRFMSNPTAFLNEHSVAVSSCNLLNAEQSLQDSPPTVTLFQDCVAMILLNCFVDSGVNQIVVTKGVETPQQVQVTGPRDAVL